MVETYYKSQYTKPVDYVRLGLGLLLLYMMRDIVTGAKFFPPESVMITIFQHSMIAGAFGVLLGIWNLWVGVRNAVFPDALIVGNEGIYAPRHFKRALRWDEFESFGTDEEYVGLEMNESVQRFPTTWGFALRNRILRKNPSYLVLEMEHTDFDKSEFGRALAIGMKSRHSGPTRAPLRSESVFEPVEFRPSVQFVKEQNYIAQMSPDVRQVLDLCARGDDMISALKILNQQPEVGSPYRSHESWQKVNPMVVLTILYPGQWQDFTGRYATHYARDPQQAFRHADLFTDEYLDKHDEAFAADLMQRMGYPWPRPAG